MQSGETGRRRCCPLPPAKDGEDPLLRELQARLDTDRFAWGYRELDPDIFGEELATPAYALVDRIAATALLVVRTG